jgi:hypothetical protein
MGEENARIILVAECPCGKGAVVKGRIFVCSCGTNVLAVPYVRLEDVSALIEQAEFQRACHLCGERP